MDYTYLRIIDQLLSFSTPSLVDRLNETTLLSPESVYSTRVEIDQGNNKKTSTEVYGIVPSNYVGQDVLLLQSCYKLGKSNRLLFMQELYVGTERVINQSVVVKK